MVMVTKQKATLVRLNDTDLTIEDETEDIRGRQVIDLRGEDLGEIEDLLIDDRDQKVRFIEVASGGFLGLGATRFLIPVDAIDQISDEAVLINQTRERIATAPRYDPMLVDDSYYEELYGYYGYSPYWSAGYTYPAYPFV